MLRVYLIFKAYIDFINIIVYINHFTRHFNGKKAMWSIFDLYL